MHVVFDVDGCLIDSSELVRQAYLAAGAVAPDDVLAYEGVDWLGALGLSPCEAASLRRRKNMAYLEHVGDAATLPPYAVARRLARDGYPCRAYTGAPHGTIDVLRRALPGWPFADAFDGVTTPARMLRLDDMGTDLGVYVDDQGRLVDLPPRWHFVHYTGQDENMLYDEIIRHLGTR